MKTLTPKTPNALPPCILALGERFGCASITSLGARHITHIDCGTIEATDDPAKNAKYGYPYHWVDIWATNPQTGEERILVRSKHLHMNKKKLHSFMRATTRKVATFIFETKG